MPLWLAALIVCLLGTGAGLGYAAWRALQLWRGARRTMGVLGAGGGRITDGLATLSASSARLAEAPGRIGAAGAGLQRSLGIARYVADSLAEARSGAEPVTALVRRRGRERGRRRAAGA